MLPTPNPPATPDIYSFSTPEGHALCRPLIYAKLKYDPHDYQLEGVCKALDGIDLLAVTPTGSGKTGFLTMYLLMMHAIIDNPSLCAPKKPPPHFRKDGAMVVVCRSRSTWCEPKFIQAGLRTLVINADTADKERREKKADIWDRAPDQHVLLLAPEQLSSKGFQDLLLKKVFQHRVVALGVDEAHLLVTWGKSFCKAFQAIGPARVRFDFPPILIVLTATLRTGAHYHGVCTFLGLHHGHFHFIRRSNVRYDIRFLFRTVASSAQGIMFPELDWLLSEKRRVIVFCRTIAVCFRVAKYLMARVELSDCTDYGTLDERIRMYTALDWDSYNEQTLITVHSGAASWAVVATDTLSVGVDISGTQDVVLYDFELPVDSDAILQKAGRIRDGKGEGSRVIVYLPRSAMEVCQSSEASEGDANR
ncbi:P-loop containing nucleoside triphosphate hydrolase protein [Ganoderma leucocontextum]|nr:P-loop containing nucleoside triphosphate hydrolase protein [Ganoderma leucocontextum]KAI1784201.1 P-loop containing nucleoside triphosphate hydrolase protein [Ganoderma leucocontextum]